MKHLLTLLVVLFATVSAVQAATIHGTVYDLSLDPAINAQVEINTAPKQSVIAVDGKYSFNVPNGEYKLTARIIENGETTAFAAEDVSVQTDGNYVLDLIVFPDFTEEEIIEGTEEVDLNEAIFDAETTAPWIRLLIALGAFALVGIAVWFWQNYAKKHTDNEEQAHTPVKEELPATERDDAAAIIEFIKKEGGRTTQKDIRKHSPLSEAKISLIVAELESKGVVEKIKKGRGNIIVLK